MPSYQFGKAFTVTYYPTDTEGDAIKASTDAPNIYLFGHDNKPGRDVILSGTGAIETVTSWTKNGSGYDITFAAVDDPEPDSHLNTRDYYIGINFTLEAGEQVQARMIAIQLSRPLGYDNELNITSCDIEKYFHTVDDWITNHQQDSFVNEAIEWVRNQIRDNGYHYALITNPEDLRIAVIQRAINRIAMSLIADGNTGFIALKDDSMSEANKTLTRLQALIDTDADGEADKKVTSVSNNYGIIVR
jgi:hypothetical protein